MEPGSSGVNGVLNFFNVNENNYPKSSERLFVKGRFHGHLATSRYDCYVKQIEIYRNLAATEMSTDLMALFWYEQLKYEKGSLKELEIAQARNWKDLYAAWDELSQLEMDSVEKPRFSLDNDALEYLALAVAEVEDDVVVERPTQENATSNLSWLVFASQEFVQKNQVVGLGGMEIAKSILSCVGGQEAEGKLFDLLGIEGIELIQEIMSKSWGDVDTEIDVKGLEKILQESTDRYLKNTVVPELTARPARSAGIVVETQSEKNARKQQGKRYFQNKKALKKSEHSWLEEEQTKLAADHAINLRANSQPWEQANTESLLVKHFGQIDGGFQTDTQQSTLPKGTLRTHHSGYEKVVIPIPSKPDSFDEANLISISSLDEKAQLAFKGIDTLNRLQSKLFPSAYHTNENLLVCAPTGSGKTNVAMLSILQVILFRLNAEQLQKWKGFKIIYVAPMKALAQEVVDKFSQRLAPLRLRVAELTGDMQMTKQEIENTHIIVTTPEKWDVVTRKSSSDGDLIGQLKLLIIDEVHLLADDRGSVIETIVARTLRFVEKSQSMIRIVGLSATLPNYKDVAKFLRVNPTQGLFYFNESYRPVPLQQTYIGVTDKGRFNQVKRMNSVVYEEALTSIRSGHQVMVFVHSRKDTSETMRAIRELATTALTISEFQGEQDTARENFATQVRKSKNKELRELFESGFGMHHAGMLRADRSLTERMFEAGAIRVLCCTATLAWGVNLPAHTVLIKGTQIYNAEKGGLMPLSMLDVMQIFGRAGRPQYDTSGEAVMITTHAELAHYLRLLTHQMPIESNFIKSLPNHLNAEIVSGTVSTMDEASTWLGYTYLHTRMCANPMAYGVTYEEKEYDPSLVQKRKELLLNAANILSQVRMIRFDERNGKFAISNTGRVASHYYIHHESIRTFNEMLRENLSASDLMSVICSSTEFEQIKVRDDESKELSQLRKKGCPLEIDAEADTPAGKANILLQAYISRMRVSGFTLTSDTNYIAQNAARVSRALFEIVLKKGWPTLAGRLLAISKSLDKRVWWFQNPLRQFPALSLDSIYTLEKQKIDHRSLSDMNKKKLANLLGTETIGLKIQRFASYIPHLNISIAILPITGGVLRLRAKIRADFVWNESNGLVEPWWILIEDSDGNALYHSEAHTLHRRYAFDEQQFDFTVPIFQPSPEYYTFRMISDRWVGVEMVHQIDMTHVVLPELAKQPYTDLLDLPPMPKSALKNEKFENLFSFTHFNPIQTQVFQELYHTDNNVLVGAPTGSGKTVCSELALLRIWNQYPESKIVYIAPLKALSRERKKDWTRKFGSTIGKRVVEFTGDVSPDKNILKSADIFVTTPEKWDGVTRQWKERNYVLNVQLVVIDEIHLLGEERGPVLEMIASRMRYISSQQSKFCRIVGLSTALSNPQDLASWLGIRKEGLYNFSPAVRPVPMEVHIQGFPGKLYCPRMATMNKPIFAAIHHYSPEKPVLIFVASRRQTRLTAIDLISFCALSGVDRPFLHMEESEIDYIASNQVQDPSLAHILRYGIGMHHAGLTSNDRDIVEELFFNHKIQILICTATLAWGVNFPAHLVIVKGTEYYDGKIHRYIDFPVTDVLQMMGRAGRPQHDTKGVACILVEETKKNFYQKFLYEPFPVESCLHLQLHEHLNADIANGRIKTKTDAVEYMRWTYYFRRLMENPSYYGLQDAPTEENLNKHLLKLVSDALVDLASEKLILLKKDGTVSSTSIGAITSKFYLHYRTASDIGKGLQSLIHVHGKDEISNRIMFTLANIPEFSQVPVRPNEEVLQTLLPDSASLTTGFLSDSNTKAYCLLYGHLRRMQPPQTDLVLDSRSVINQVPRLLNAMLDIALTLKSSFAFFQTLHLLRCFDVRFAFASSELWQLPHATEFMISSLLDNGISSLKDFQLMTKKSKTNALKKLQLSTKHIDDIIVFAQGLPEFQPLVLDLVKKEDNMKINVQVSVKNYSSWQASQRSDSNTHRGRRKSFGVWLAIISKSTGNLMDHRRLSFAPKMTCYLQIKCDTSAPDCGSDFEWYILPDWVAGIDINANVV